MMAEYIEREAAVKVCTNQYKECLRKSDWCGDTVAWNIGFGIKALPAADVVEVRHGRWVQVICHVEFEDGFVDRLYECCSRCHKPNGRKMPDYCPNCGAKMEVNDMLEFSTTSERKARKCHVCDLCGAIIKIGEKYIRFSGKYEGEMIDTKHHLMCREIIYQFCDDTDSFEYTDDEVIEWLQEKICYNCEHSWHGDGKDDCETSIFLCPKVIERFYAKDGEG